MISTAFLILWSTLVINTVLMVIVYKRNPRSATNVLFSILCVIVDFWLAASYFSTTPMTHLWWSRMTIFFASPMTLLLFLFSHTLPESKLILGKGKVAVAVFATALVMIVTISPYTFVSVDFTDPLDGRLVVGPGMGIFALLATSYSLMSIFLLAKKFQTLTGLKREQVRFVLLGVSLMLLFLILTVMLPTILYQEDAFVKLIPAYTLVFLGMSAYAIIRYRLLDIRMIIARAISFLALIALTAAGYSFILFGIGGYLFNIEVSTPLFLVSWLFSVIAMLTFNPIEALLRKMTDRIFFTNRYDPDAVLKAVGRVLVGTIRIDAVGYQIVTILMRDLRLEKVGLVSFRNNIVYGWSAKGLPDALPERLGELLEGEDRLRPHLFDELPDGDLKNLFRIFNISAIFPLVIHKKNVGLLILGHKRSGEPLNDEDISFIEILSQEIAIGMQNAQSYEEIRRFNLELEERVSERTKELKESQKQELEKAQEVSRLKDEFVFLAVHELRTPITAIRGFLELTEGSMPNFPKDVQENLLAIRQASEHVNQLVNDILEIARSEKGTQTLNLKPLDFKPILDDVLKEVSSLVKEKDLRITAHVVEPLPKVQCDPVKLKEVLMNLVGNAIKYNRHHGEIFVSAFLRPTKTDVLFEIRDTGYGIPRDQQEKIFQKFFRAVTDETQDILGTGLGLFITRMLVERMGGTIMFSSIEHEGTTFTFTLPVQLPEEAKTV